MRFCLYLLPMLLLVPISATGAESEETSPEINAAYQLDLLEVTRELEAAKVAYRCFLHGLMIELSGRSNEVLKLQPAVNMTKAHLRKGIANLTEALVMEIDRQSQPRG